MPRPGPRKRRTREHVIADMSRVHVEGIVVDAGFSAEQTAHDYGYDLYVTTYDEQGYVEPERVLFQLKATDTIERAASGTDYVFQIDRRDYELWTREFAPVYIILFDARQRRAYWLWIQDYFASAPRRRPRAGARSVRVRIPSRNVVDHNFMGVVREAKADALRRRMEQSDVRER